MRFAPLTEDRVRSHLAQAYAEESYLTPNRTPKGEDVIFRALCNAHAILRRIPNQDFPKMNIRSGWPPLMLSREEREEAYRQVQWAIIEGAPEDSKYSTTQVTPQEIAVMEDVMHVFRECCKGRHIGRDWRILNMFAIGMSTYGVAKQQIPRMTVQAVREAATRQKQAISASLRFLMPSL